MCHAIIGDLPKESKEALGKLIGTRYPPLSVIQNTFNNIYIKIFEDLKKGDESKIVASFDKGEDATKEALASVLEKSEWRIPNNLVRNLRAFAKTTPILTMKWPALGNKLDGLVKEDENVEEAFNTLKEREENKLNKEAKKEENEKKEQLKIQKQELQERFEKEENEEERKKLETAIDKLDEQIYPSGSNNDEKTQKKQEQIARQHTLVGVCKQMKNNFINFLSNLENAKKFSEIEVKIPSKSKENDDFEIEELPDDFADPLPGKEKEKKSEESTKKEKPKKEYTPETLKSAIKKQESKVEKHKEELESLTSIKPTESRRPLYLAAMGAFAGLAFGGPLGMMVGGAAGYLAGKLPEIVNFVKQKIETSRLKKAEAKLEKLENKLSELPKKEKTPKKEQEKNNHIDINHEDISKITTLNLKDTDNNTKRPENVGNNTPGRNKSNTIS